MDWVSDIMSVFLCCPGVLCFLRCIRIGCNLDKTLMPEKYYCIYLFQVAQLRKLLQRFVVEMLSLLLDCTGTSCGHVFSTNLAVKSHGRLAGRPTLSIPARAARPLVRMLLTLTSGGSPPLWVTNSDFTTTTLPAGCTFSISQHGLTRLISLDSIGQARTHLW